MKVKIVFYSMYGHIYRMAEATAEGAREVEGAEVQLLQVPELVPEDVLERSGAKEGRAAFAHIPAAKPDDLADADAVIFGRPTRFGNMCAQMRHFLDQRDPLGMDGSRMPSENELAIARFQGRHVATIAAKLAPT